jgi:hypothetical protein
MTGQRRKDAVWRIPQSGGTLLVHLAAPGKTSYLWAALGPSVLLIRVPQTPPGSPDD